MLRDNNISNMKFVILNCEFRFFNALLSLFDEQPTIAKQTIKQKIDIMIFFIKPPFVLECIKYFKLYFLFCYVVFNFEKLGNK